MIKNGDENVETIKKKNITDEIIKKKTTKSIKNNVMDKEKSP